MKPQYKQMFSKEEKAMFKKLADQVRAKREAITATPATSATKGLLP